MSLFCNLLFCIEKFIIINKYQKIEKGLLSLYVILPFVLVTLFSAVTISIVEAREYVNREHNINFEYADNWNLYETLIIEEKKRPC